MKRTISAKHPEQTEKKIRIPDIINHSVTKEFTQIPNDLLRNPDISGKAKALLCLLLSNKEGWYSYITTLKQMMKEGEDAIRSAIEELESHSYLMRIRYRDKDTKTWKGGFWVYTDVPGVFTSLEHTKQELLQQGMEVVMPENPHVENPDVANPDVENPVLKRHNNKKTKNKNINLLRGEEEDPLIKTSQFDEFWKLYPRKVDKGKAKTIWKRICSKKDKSDIPTWKEIKRAIKKQNKSERWQTKEFIPHPSTWLNQSRWLDDPKQMVSFNKPHTNGRPINGYMESGWKQQSPTIEM